MGKARVLPGAAPDPLLARLRLERRLAAAPRPAGLPPQAVLCVRALRDPLPGRLDLGDAGPPGRWEQALADELGRLARVAARPALGPVPAGAASVLFADRAELLACLAADWLDGLVAGHWWWRRLLADAHEPRAPVGAWRDAPQLLPSALALLAATGRAQRFAAALTGDEAAALVAALAACFGLPPPPEAEAAVERAAAASVEAVTPAARPAARPWLAWAPECAAGLAPEQELFLGLGLGLARAPALVRAPALAMAVRAWRVGAVPAVERPDAPPPAAEPAPRQSPVLPAARRAASTDEVDARPRQQRAVQSPLVPHRRGAAAGDSLAPSQAPGAAPQAPGQTTSPSTPAVWAEAQDPALLIAPGPALPAGGQAVTTDLGGLFFLVNVGLFLELYGDFTSPARPGISLDLWDFVTLVGQALLAGADAEDPAWALLAALAGRAAAEPPGVGFASPAVWRTPPAWLTPFGPRARWSWSACAGRLRVRDEAGFTVLDVPMRGEPRATLARELAPYRAAGLEPVIAPGRPRMRRAARPLARWLGLLLPYLRARLRLALACADEELAGLLIRRPARVVLSPARIDIHMDLAGHPLELRLAGLDRDPGWVPAAGRALAFHFEVQDANAL